MALTCLQVLVRLIYHPPCCCGSPCENAGHHGGRHGSRTALNCRGQRMRLLAPSWVDQEAERRHVVGQTIKLKGPPWWLTSSRGALLPEGSSTSHSITTNRGPNLQMQSLCGTFHIPPTTRFSEAFRIIIFRHEVLRQNRLWVLLLHSFSPACWVFIIYQTPCWSPMLKVVNKSSKVASLVRIEPRRERGVVEDAAPGHCHDGLSWAQCRVSV